MFEYSKMKEELEQIKCPQHGKTATAIFANGKVSFENVCCQQHQQKLDEALPEIEERQDIADILEDVF